MKKLAYLFLLGLILIHSAISLAQDGAVNITIGSKHGSVDHVAVQRIREAVGTAISSGIVDLFYVYLPRQGGPASTELGVSACAESGFNSSPERFNEFVTKLGSIPHEPQTVVRLERIERCDDIDPIEPLDCGGILGGQCPRLQYCELSIGHCKTRDAPGACRVIPNACRDDHNPVCGCDGKTYKNACEAARALVSLDHHGKCKRPEELVCDESRPENCRKSN